MGEDEAVRPTGDDAGETTPQAVHDDLDVPPVPIPGSDAAEVPRDDDGAADPAPTAPALVEPGPVEPAPREPASVQPPPAEPAEGEVHLHTDGVIDVDGEGEGEGETTIPAPDPSPTSVADAIGAVRGDVAVLGEQLGEVERRTKELARLNQRNVEHVEALHAENVQLRQGEIQRAVAPMVRDLMGLHDDVADKLLPTADPGGVADLEIVLQRLRDVLSRWGVVEIAPQRGDRFDPKLHEGARRVDDPDAEPGTIADLVRRGFRYDEAEGRVLRPARVAVVTAPDDTPAATAEAG